MPLMPGLDTIQRGPLAVRGGGESSSVSNQYSTGTQASSSAQQAASQAASFSQSYIPEYSQTPILESIARQAQAMAPEVYQWGMNQYNKNQGNIDSMMRNAMTYASPERIASEMGRAEAGVQQGAEAGRQSAIKDLQSYGIDPSSGRYAALDQASRVMSGAAAAGAGNQQREATTAQGAAMQSAATGASLQNQQIGYGAAGAATGALGVASQLKYSPLGTMSGSSQQSQSAGQTSSTGSQSSGGGSISSSYNLGAMPMPSSGGRAQGGMIEGGEATNGNGDETSGGFVSQELSPSAGAQVDDVQARLNSGEFVIPKDVAAWKGQEFFYKLMAQARKMRATAGSENGMGMQENGATEGQTGYADGGCVTGQWGNVGAGGGDLTKTRCTGPDGKITAVEQWGNMGPGGTAPFRNIGHIMEESARGVRYAGGGPIQSMAFGGAAGVVHAPGGGTFRDPKADQAWQSHMRKGDWDQIPPEEMKRISPPRVAAESPGETPGGSPYQTHYGAAQGGPIPTGYAGGGDINLDKWRATWAQNNLISPAERTGIEPATRLDFETGEFNPNPRSGGQMTPIVNVKQGMAAGGEVPGYALGGGAEYAWGGPIGTPKHSAPIGFTDPRVRQANILKYQREVISPAEKTGFAPPYFMDFNTGESIPNPKAGQPWMPEVTVKPSRDDIGGAT